MVLVNVAKVSINILISMYVQVKRRHTTRNKQGQFVVLPSMASTEGYTPPVAMQDIREKMTFL